MNPHSPNQTDLKNAATQAMSGQPARDGDGGRRDGSMKGGGGDESSGGGSGGLYHGDDGTPVPDPVRIGPFRIHRRLGAGGMGAVYLATRDGDRSNARVAIKVVKRGMDTEQIMGRFEQERRMLEALNHDHIARFITADVTPEGQPYFVMEFVDGLPIDEYCDTNRLPIGQRLELFRTLCQAVHAAHQNRIVHRDIKPSNVVATPDGKVKLLDFGIAKLINPALGHAAAPTLTSQGPMTPEYASPEQVRGDPLSGRGRRIGEGV